MHQLWSYSGDKRIKQDVGQVRLLCAKIQKESSHTRRRVWRSEIQKYCYRLSQEQSILNRALRMIERDWYGYIDVESRDEYYAHLTQLYLLAGGHWAGVQEGGALHELTHHPTPLWHRPESHSVRGANKLFKN